MKAVSVVGARPNFVKLSAIEPLIREKWDHIIVHTGQHYDYELSKIFFDNLEIPSPHYYLGVGSGTHAYQVGEAMKRLEKLLLIEKPDTVIVYGDTNSTLAGALAAVKAGFMTAHVEAGLRSWDMKMPEEVNRRVVDHISQILFAPTQGSLRNLREERVPGRYFLTGDVHVDVLRRWLPTAERSDIVERLNIKGDYLLVTVHRAENMDPARLKILYDALLSLSSEFEVVFPMHPRTKKSLSLANLLSKLERVARVIEPLGYLDFIKLLKQSSKVLTDSGGVQREAYLLEVPCVVFRDRTEWVELVDSGWVKLAYRDADQIVKTLREFEKPEFHGNLLGDGNASKRIVTILEGEVRDD